MNYLIDTNVISELRKRKACNPNVAAWFAAIDEDDLFLSALTIASEVDYGIGHVGVNHPSPQHDSVMRDGKIGRLRIGMRGLRVVQQFALMGIHPGTNTNIDD